MKGGPLHDAIQARDGDAVLDLLEGGYRATPDEFAELRAVFAFKPGRKCNPESMAWIKRKADAKARYKELAKVTWDAEERLKIVSAESDILVETLRHVVRGSDRAVETFIKERGGANVPAY